MGWSRRDVDIPVNTSAQNPVLSRLQSLNPFGNSGYVSLPTQEPGAPLPAPSRREEDEGIFARESKKTATLIVVSSHKVAGDKMRVPAHPLLSHAVDHAPPFNGFGLQPSGQYSYIHMYASYEELLTDSYFVL